MTAQDPHKVTPVTSVPADKASPEGTRPAPTVHAPEGPTMDGGKARDEARAAHGFGGATASKPGNSIGELVAKITSQFSALVRDEIKYTGVQAKTKASRFGKGAGFLAVAGVLALYMLGLLLTAASIAFGNIVPMWAGFLIVAGILLVIIAFLALMGKSAIDKAKKAEVDPKSGLNKNVEALKKGFEK